MVEIFFLPEKNCFQISILSYLQVFLETVDRREFSGEPKLCNRIDTWKTVNRILAKGRWVETANPQDRRNPNQAKEAL